MHNSSKNDEGMIKNNRLLVPEVFMIYYIKDVSFKTLNKSIKYSKLIK